MPTKKTIKQSATVPAVLVSATPQVPGSTTPAPATPAPATPPATPPPPLVTAAAGSSATHGTKVDVEASYQALIAGLLALYQPTDVFQLKSGTFTRDEIVAQLQTFVAAAETTKASNQVWRSDVQAEAAVEITVRPIRQGLRGIAQARFGNDGAELLKLGFAMAKTAKRSAAVKAEAVVKAAATRVARGTVGKKKKLAIKGVPAATTAPAAPAPVAAPASPVTATPGVATPVAATTPAPAAARPTGAAS
jgi:pyruvate dehydrogenase E2 component (dihydrolipoamide acetyltransferase)